MDRRLELARMLLGKAADDLTMARRLAGDQATPDWGVAFHVQQSVEKAMKAVLCSRGIEYPRTHNIATLLDLLAEHSLKVPVATERLEILTPYGVLFRYDAMEPSDGEMESLPDRASLLALGEAVMNWAVSEHALSD